MNGQPTSQAAAGRFVGTAGPRKTLPFTRTSRESQVPDESEPPAERRAPRTSTTGTKGPSLAVTRRSANLRAIRHGMSLLSALVSIGLVVTVLLTGAPAGVTSANSNLAPTTTPPLTLTIHGVAATETPYFWATDPGGSANVATSVQAALLNATPIKTLRYGDNWVDQSNWSDNCYYNDNNVCSTPQASPTSFATLCQWVRDECVLGVPAESNRASTVTALLHWFAKETSWTPDCWSIGNEPQDWTHFNIPWTSWSSEDASTPTAAQFATVAANLTGAIRHIYPGACIVGIENNDNVARSAPWTSAVLAAAPNVSAVAIHSYPDNHCTGPYLSSTNLTSVARQYEDAKAVSDGLPVYNHEFNIGLGTGAQACKALGTVTAAVFVSATAAQVLELGMPQFAYFRFYCSSTYDCMYDSGTNTPTPIYTLYSELFTHMDISTIRNVTFSSGADPGTFAAEGSDNATDSSLLLSNAVTSTWENVSLAGVSPSNWTGEVYTQDTAGTVSRMDYVPGMTVSLPPESTIVVKMYQAAGNGSGGSGPSGTPPTTWTLGGTVSLADATIPADLTVQLTFSLQNGSTTELDAAVGPAGAFSIGNLTFTGTFASARLGPGTYTVVNVNVNNLVPQTIFLSIFAEASSPSNSTNPGNNSSGSGPPGRGETPLPLETPLRGQVRVARQPRSLPRGNPSCYRSRWRRRWS